MRSAVDQRLSWSNLSQKISRFSVFAIAPVLAVAFQAPAVNAAGLGEIKVTAEKRASNVQDTPIAISVWTGDSLDRQGIDSAMALQNASPSLVFGAWGGFGQPYVRGIGNELITLAADSSTSVYVDGVYMARPSAALQQLLDVDRVEVLRGPQGTLYGRNSVGGSINIHSIQPGPDRNVVADIRYGNYNKVRARVAANVPLIDGKLYARFSGIRTSSRGFMTNLTDPAAFSSVAGVGPVRRHYGEDDLIAGKAIFKLIANDNLDFVLTIDATRDHGTQTTTNSVITSLPSPAIPPGRTHPSPFKNFLNFTPVEQKDQWGVNLTVNWDLGGATLKSVSSFRNTKQDAFFDVDSTDFGLNHERIYIDSDTVTQELNLISNGDGPLEWVVGAFYFNDDGLSDTPLSLASGAFLLDFFGTLETEAWAGFAQASYRIGSLAKLTVGGRYSSEKKTISVNHQAIMGGGPLTTLLNVSKASDSWDSFTPKVGIDVFVAEDVMVYASVSKGVKSGGFNMLSLDPSTFGYDPEKLWAYEVGLKSEFLDNRVRFNATGFWYDQSDRQEQVASAFGAVTANAASATVKGIELESTFLITEGLELNGSYSYLDATFDSYLTEDPDRPALGVLDLGALGNTVPRAPKHSWVASAAYTHDVGNSGELTWYGQFSWKSRVFHDVYNEVNNSQGSFGLLSGRIMYKPLDQKWHVGVYGNNLTNKTWFQTGIRNTAFFGSFHIVAEPRTFGVEAGIDW